MFSEEQLNEFVNKMFENASNSTNNNAKEGLSTFRKYLGETNMCSPEYLKKLDKKIELGDVFFIDAGSIYSF